MVSDEKIYCSLDLELTGFDPTVDEILEVGFVLFSMQNGLPVIIEQWSKVFKPVRMVRPKILALTGISRMEIEAAPKFSEFQEFLKEKLAKVTLIGHSISVDVRFLEACGVPIAQPSIDTLDLVQFLLPTHHSYNLENLMHYFQVPHPEAHRALEDAKATVAVLTRLLKIFYNFPEHLQSSILSLVVKQDFSWKPLFASVDSRNDSVDLAVAAKDRFAKNPVFAASKPPKFAPNTIYNFPLNDNLSQFVVGMASGSAKFLCVVKDSSEVLELYKQGLVVPLFSPEDTFNKERFEAFASRENLGSVEALFILKILVWQSTNWQQSTILDINFSASGRQFKSLITGGVALEPYDDLVLCVDYNTFLHFLETPFYTDRKVVIESMDSFQKFITAGLGVSISWNKVLSILKSFYNPETKFGNADVAAVVTSALASTDLFFGLVRLLFKNMQGSLGVSDIDPFLWGKLLRAAEHYEARLKIAQEVLRSSELKEILYRFAIFFGENKELVKWLEISDTRCAFFAQPLSLAETMESLKRHYPSISFVSSLTNGGLVDYFSQKLFVSHFKQERVVVSGVRSLAVYSTNRTLLGRDMVAVSLMLTPALIVFNSTEELKAFYDVEFLELKTGARVFALGYSGGASKMIRNFGIAPNSLLLTTADFLYKQTAFKIKAKHLFFTTVPKVNILHPYTKAEGLIFPGGLEQYRDVRLMDLLFTIVNMCDSSLLERITFANVQEYEFLTKFIEEIPGATFHSI